MTKETVNAMKKAIARLDVLIEAAKPIKELFDKINARRDKDESKN